MKIAEDNEGSEDWLTQTVAITAGIAVRADISGR